LAIKGQTVMCGMERISLRVASALVQLGERVTIVAEEPEPSLLREARRAGARVIEGRWSDVAQLQAAGLEDARCIVLTENADLRNVQVALAAREVNPHVRVVLRMFNAELADRATRLLANSRVVSSSAEAAPYFAAAALGMAAAPDGLAWGRRVVVVADEAVADPPQETRTPGYPRRSLVGGAPRIPGDPGDGDAFGPVPVGDGESLRPMPPPALPSRRHWRRAALYRRALLAVLDPRLAILGSLVTILLVASVAIFHSTAGLYPDAAQPTGISWLNALLFTATTAYGNTDLTHAPWMVKLYAILFMFAAALGLAVTFGLVADVLIGAQIQEALGVPRGRMRNHVVVLGLGNLGYRTVLNLLAAGVEVAACDSLAGGRFVAIARRLGVPVLIADANYLDSLRALSVDRARAVVAATSDDLANLEAALAARELNPDARVITRLFDQELAERAQEQLHITECQSVSALATPAFVAAALGEGVLSIIERRRCLWLLGEAAIRRGCDAEGKSLRELEAEDDLRVLAIREGGETRWRPSRTERLRAGQEVLVACGREAWERLCSSVAQPIAAGV
jgi:Trk K+ transport system NAD-binding subunit